MNYFWSAVDFLAFFSFSAEIFMWSRRGLRFQPMSSHSLVRTVLLARQTYWFCYKCIFSHLFKSVSCTYEYVTIIITMFLQFPQELQAAVYPASPWCLSSSVLSLKPVTMPTTMTTPTGWAPLSLCPWLWHLYLLKNWRSISLGKNWQERGKVNTHLKFDQMYSARKGYDLSDILQGCLYSYIFLLYYLNDIGSLSKIELHEKLCKFD